MKLTILMFLIFYFNNVVLLFNSDWLDFYNETVFWIFSPFILLLFTINLDRQHEKWLVVTDFFIRYGVASLTIVYVSGVSNIAAITIWLWTFIGFLVSFIIECILFKKQNLKEQDEYLYS